MKSTAFEKSFKSSWISKLWIAHLVSISLRYFWGEIRRAVDGLLSVVTFETALPPLKVVTVTLGATVLTALVAFAVCEVLRVRVLRVFVGVAAGDLTGIKTEFVCLPSYYKHKKTPVGVLCDSLSTVFIFH